MSFTIKDGVFTVDIRDFGDYPVNGTLVQIATGWITLEQGKTYKLVFDAVSTVEREVDAGFKVSDNNRYVNERLVIGTELSTYTIIFTVEKKLLRIYNYSFI
ncbi:MAG: hypothetical protein GX490_00540 [Bacilli bacterium]|nr:hypothetical protein [Bacilli bacterium]